MKSKVFKKIMLIVVVGLLTMIVVFNLLNEYIVDLQGISFEGFYECEGKRLSKITLDKYYPPFEIWGKARSLGYSGQLHTGFGEPDSQGSGLYIDVQVAERTYRLLFVRVRDLSWKKVVVYSNRISNSCSTPYSVLKKEVTSILNTLGIETSGLSGFKFTHDYKLPWFSLPLL